MKKITIKLGKPKKKRTVWGFNPSPKVMADKKKINRNRKIWGYDLWKEYINEI